jgi:hypothetical protein
LPRLLVVLFVTVVMAACGGLDRVSYVRSNEAAFRAIPLFPGARVISERSSEVRAEEDGPVVGYVTLFEIVLPPVASADTIASFYTRRLLSRWQLAERLDGPVLNFHRHGATLSVNIDNWRVHRMEIAVDHRS